MIVETFKLSDVGLRYAVAIAERAEVVENPRRAGEWLLRWPGCDRWLWFEEFRPDAGAEGDDIIDREHISTFWNDDGWWEAIAPTVPGQLEPTMYCEAARRVAALRSWISRLHGNVVDIPDRLLYVPEADPF